MQLGKRHERDFLGEGLCVHDALPCEPWGRGEAGGGFGIYSVYRTLTHSCL